MRVLFVMRHPGYVRNFEAVLRELSHRKHDVHLAFEGPTPRWLDGVDPMHGVLAQLEGVTVRVLPKAPSRVRLPARAIRYSLDYLRYLGPEYRRAPRLRARAARRVPAIVRVTAIVPLVRAALAAVLRRIERLLPRGEADALLGDVQPDVLLVTPLVGLGSEQVDYVRAAQARAIPAVHLVASWDNLTNKALLRALPDLVVVWNEAQAREAAELHGVPRGRIAVTGAHTYDHWFGWGATATRSEFCARVGLRSDEPYVLYACSSSFVAPDELSFVGRWVAALRESGLVRVGVLVRPHPQNARQWDGNAAFDDERVSVWPPAGEDPVDGDRRSAYFDSIVHAAAVVGINTSALIEAAIAGRPVLTVVTDEFRDTQTGTLHFAHLMGAEGALDVATSLPEHIAHLRAALDGDVRDRTPFVRSFVRPHGLDRPAAPQVADVLERVVGR